VGDDLLGVEGVAGLHDPVGAGEVAPPHAVGVGELVRRGEDGQQRVGPQQLDVEACVLGAEVPPPIVDHGEVGPAESDEVEAFGALDVDDVERQAGLRCPERGERGRENAEDDAGEGGDAQRGDVARGDLVDGCLGAVQRGEHALCVLGEPTPGRRRADGPADALDELAPHLAFQSSQLLRHRRWRDPQRVGDIADAAAARELIEDAQPRDVEHDEHVVAMLQRRDKQVDWLYAPVGSTVSAMSTITDDVVRTAPWASDRALRRLHEVERGVPADPAAALRAAARAAAGHEERVEHDALVLYAGGNVPSAGVADAHRPRLSNQPSMGYAGDKFQAGLEQLDVLEVTVARLIAEVMAANFAEVRPTSATLANLAVYSAVAQPGDTIAVLPAWAGGHLSHHAVGAAGIRGLRVVDLPYDVDLLDVDLDRLADVLAATQPKLVVIGASLMLHPHRVPPIADAVHAAGSLLLYDASHVAGLLAEGRFQTPLADGADVMTFSTYKSFGGPAGGAIVADDAELMQRITSAVYPGLTANYDIARLLPLGVAALEHRSSAGGYADQCIGLAGELAAALADEGLEVVTSARGATSSHHLAVDVRQFGGGPAAARALAEANVLLSEIGLPGPDHDAAGAIRIGTQTIARQGCTAEEIPAIAAVLRSALHADRPVAELRDQVARIRAAQRARI